MTPERQMTPEEDALEQEQELQELQRRAQMQAAAVRGQPPQQPDTINPQALLRQADVFSGLGGAMAGWGGKSGQAVSENATHQGDALREIVARRHGSVANESNRGMWEALKSEFPDIAARYKEGELSEAAAGKVYMQASNDRRVHYSQGEVNSRFGKSYGLSSEKQAADLGAREVSGAFHLDPAAPKHISQEQATNLANMKAAADTVVEKTAKAKQIYGRGTPLPGSKDDAFIRQLITETYGPMLTTGNIGNLTDSHLHLLKDMLQNPSGDLRTYFNNDLFPSMLDEIAKGAVDNLEHQAGSMGRTFRAPRTQKAAGGAIAQPKSEAEYNKLPSGTIYIGPEGKKHKKP